MRRLIVVCLAALVASVATFAGTGSSQSAPLPLQFAVLGDNFGTIGNHSFCRGAINVRLSVPKGKKGVVRVTATSHGFTGDGPGWRRNPVCRMVLGTEFISARGYLVPKYSNVAFGPKPGTRVVQDVHTGSGPVAIETRTYAPNSGFRQIYSRGVSYYVLVP